MRISNLMTSTIVLNDLSNSMEQLQATQTKLSSGYDINKPSDDPVGTARVMALSTNLSANNQYQRNISDAKGWLQTTDQALANIGSAVQRVRTLSIQGANATLTDTDRQAIAKEINQLINNVADNANASYGDRYIFGGNHTGSNPFTVVNNANGEPTSVTYAGDAGHLQYEIGQSVYIQGNVDGKTALSVDNSAPPKSLLCDDLIKIRDDLGGDGHPVNTDDLGGIDLTNLDNDMNNLLASRASVGARLNRLTLDLSQAKTANLNLTSTKAGIYEVDVAKTITNFSMQQAAYQDALAVGAKIIQPSLLDFLK